MLPKTLVLDEVQTPKDFDELLDLVSTTHRVEHEQTTFESISVQPDGMVRTPAGEWQVTRDFLEDCSRIIGMPLGYAYKVTPALFCENVAQRQSETTVPVTVSRIGQVATGLISDRKSRYRPACTADVLRAVRHSVDWEFRRASVSFAGVDVELVLRGKAIEPVVGDTVEVGIALTNSESGGRQLKASAYSYRLVCTNGAIMADSVGLSRWPNDPRMTDAACLRAFTNGVNELAARLEPVAALYSHASERRIPDVELWNLWRRVAYLLPQSAADEALSLAGDERRDLQQVIRARRPMDAPVITDHVVYDVHNRITHAAHGQPFRIRRGLQEIGGDLLSRAAAWPVGFSIN